MAGVRWRWSWRGPDGNEAGHLGLVFDAARGLVEVTATLARPSHDLVTLSEPEAPRPRPGSMEVRASGLWADAVEEEPGERWTIGLEAFALAVEHPADTVGVRTPLGFDLEWERAGPDADGVTPARVHGEVLVGVEALEVGAPGAWARWGGDERRR